jgi:hypothetical protein
MLLPRCTHRRLLLLREYHTTRKFSGAIQIDPFTARAETNWEPSSPSSSQPESISRKPKKRRAERHDKEKINREGPSDQTKLSTLLGLHDSSVRYSRTVEGAKGTARRTRSRKGRPRSPSASTKRQTHPGASGYAGGSLCYPRCLYFHLLFSTVSSQRR